MRYMNGFDKLRNVFIILTFNMMHAYVITHKSTYLVPLSIKNNNIYVYICNGAEMVHRIELYKIMLDKKSFFITLLLIISSN